MADRTRVQEVADAVVGTTGRVLNEVTVKGLNDQNAGDLDRQIHSNLDKMVKNDPTLKERDIKFEVANGMVAITGEVNTAEDLELVRAVMRRSDRQTR